MFKDESNETFHISHYFVAGIDPDRSLYGVHPMSFIPEWQSNLTSNIQQFKKFGNFDCMPTGRRLRRLLEQQARREAKQNAKHK